MAEREPYPSELDLAAAFRAYLDDAPTQVRPIELARQFATDHPHRRAALGPWHFPAVPRPAWALLMLAALLAALVVGSLAVGAFRRDIAVVPTMAPQPAGPGLVAQGRLEDPAGDLLGGDDNPVDTPAYIDIRSLEAVADGATLRLTLTLAGALPAATDPDVEHLRYAIAVHTDGDAVPERDDHAVGVGYTVALHPKGALGYVPGIRDWTYPEAYGNDDQLPVERLGPDFPGTADVAGDTIVLTVPLDALRNPHVIRIGAWAARLPWERESKWGDPGDLLPDYDSDGTTGDWLVLGS